MQGPATVIPCKGDPVTVFITIILKTNMKKFHNLCLEFTGAIKEWRVEDFLINGEWFWYKTIFRKVKRRVVSGK